MPSLADLKTHGVYFHFYRESFQPARYHYATACLAKGLQRLGVPTFSHLSGSWFETRSPNDGSVHVFTFTEATVSIEQFREIVEMPTPHKVILSMSDVNASIGTPPGIPSLLAHENRHRQVLGRRIPWAFGLSDECLQATENPCSFSERKQTILRNFRPSANQTVRQALDMSLLPHLEEHFAIDRTIGPQHFENLRSYRVCLAYGGCFDEDITRNAELASRPRVQALKRIVTYDREPVIIRWDSWRWWESLAAGCLTLQLDLEKYGLLLPVMPEPWVHYIPIDLADPKATVEKLMAEQSRWASIAEQGKIWARAHYSPEAVARRFVELAARQLWA